MNGYSERACLVAHFGISDVQIFGSRILLLLVRIHYWSSSPCGEQSLGKHSMLDRAAAIIRPDSSVE